MNIENQYRQSNLDNVANYGQLHSDDAWCVPCNEAEADVKNKYLQLTFPKSLNVRGINYFSI